MLRRAKNSGFTLVEVLISTAVMTIGMGIVVALTIQTTIYSHEEQMQNEIEREATLFLEYFHRDIVAAAAVLPDFPGLDKKAKSLVLKIPEFDEFGIHPRGEFDYVVYEYYQNNKKAVRTMYDDDMGKTPLSSLEISGDCSLHYFANGVSLSAIDDFESIHTLQLSAAREEVEHGFDYSRAFVTASTLRNPDK